MSSYQYAYAPEVPEVRDRTTAEEALVSRHPIRSRANACDFCRINPPAYWWRLTPGVAVINWVRVFTPDRVYACLHCRHALGDGGAWTARDLLRVADGDEPFVREALWAAFVRRRSSRIMPVSGYDTDRG